MRNTTLPTDRFGETHHRHIVKTYKSLELDDGSNYKHKRFDHAIAILLANRMHI